MLKLFNTLSRKIEEFNPLNPTQVGMYTCGPTVYDFMHIGNLRTFVLSDILRRTLEQNGYQVKLVQNITDIEDKIIKRALEKNIPVDELTSEYTKYFLEDINKLNILPANVLPKATEHIEAMIKYIKVLIKNDLAYVEKDGSVYFSIHKFPDYGKLSILDKRSLKTGTRILSDEYTKEDVQDFALWKSVELDEDSPSTSSGSTSWDSPWGRGRPGWHIECSVMSQEYLGETFDIHVGGVDLIFPHHENEIAQSEGKTGKQFVRYFIHGEHLLVDGKKMAKSEDNFYTLRDIEEKGFDPLALRYLFLTAHYRDKINFTWKSLEAAQNALDNLRETVREWDTPEIGCAEYEQRFSEAMDNDLNTPQALAIFWDMVKSDYPTSAKAESILKMDKVLGLRLEEYVGKKLEVPSEVIDMVGKRENARKAGDFEKSDEIRKRISDLGFRIEDTESGPILKPNN